MPNSPAPSDSTLSAAAQFFPLSVPLGDRWSIFTQLLELGVPVTRQVDGSLQVMLESPLVAVLVWSVLRREQASRLEHLAWLERCWACRN